MSQHPASIVTGPGLAEEINRPALRKEISSGTSSAPVGPITLARPFPVVKRSLAIKPLRRPRRPRRIAPANLAEVRASFDALAKKWKEETAHLSSAAMYIAT